MGIGISRWKVTKFLHPAKMKKMAHSCVRDVHTLLTSVEELHNLPDSVNLKFKTFHAEFKFLSMFLLCFPKWNRDENLRFHLSSLVTSIAETCKIEGTYSITTIAARVEDKISEWKAEIMKYLEHLLLRSIVVEPIDFENLKFLDSFHTRINNFLKRQGDEFLPLPVKSRIEKVQELVFILRSLFYFTCIGGKNCDYDDSLNFNFFVHDWVAGVVLLNWLAETEDEETGGNFRNLDIDLRQKVIRLCFESIKVAKTKDSEYTLIFGEFVSKYVDFFLKMFMLISNDDVQMVREGLILLITFLADPPLNTVEHSKLSSLTKQIHDVLDQASHTIFFIEETNPDFVNGKITLNDFQKSINEVRVEIEKLYIHVPHSLWSNFPRINRLGYFESVLVYLENLKEAMNQNKKLVPFLKHYIFTVHEELLHLRPILQDISMMQHINIEFKVLEEEIISLSYQADVAIKSSFFVDNPIWYNLSRLSFIIGKIMDIKGSSRLMRFKEKISFNNGKNIDIEGNPRLTSFEDNRSLTSSERSTSTPIVEDVVGFKHEMEVLIDRLIGGTAQLEIISIVGMGGIGKTTVARKLFNKPSIKYHFHKRAFCTVSQEYKKRNVLLDISKNVCQKSDYEVRQMSDDDIAHMLYKSLKGFKYLIVLDDIWAIDAWHDLNASFPDDKNGSRIIFTTRINNISLLANPYSTPYLLPFLSIDESWELLQQKIFYKDLCPSHLCEVGKLIAKKCQGLPLAIVVIAGLLARTERSLPQWNKVKDTLSSFVSIEECKDVIKLSYTQLPEALKSCLLYLGAFGEDNILEAKRLTLLWAAEGFVSKSGSSCLHKVAKKYLNDLSDRNLVTIMQRSYNGGIKTFRVHDLIRDFCRAEAQKVNFLCFIDAHHNEYPTPSVYEKYRLFIQAARGYLIYEKPKNPIVHSLVHFTKANCAQNSLESFLCCFKLVQVLDFQEIEIVGEFPTVVTTLVHLNFLALRLSTASYVPSEINNLWNLETLLLLTGPVYRLRPFLRYTEHYRLLESSAGSAYMESPVYGAYPYEMSFSDEIWKMKRLRRVEAGQVGHVALDYVTGAFCQLLDLEIFTSLYIPPRNIGDELLRRIPNVRKLSCLCTGWWDGHRIQLPKLEVLKKLESLKIIYVGNEVHHPYTFSFPLTVKKLTLQQFGIPWKELSSIISNLRCLEVLVLDFDSFSGKIWDVQDEEFPKIKSLTLQGLDIKELKASTDSFPCLEKLAVFCLFLIEIPPCFAEVPTLNSIVVISGNKGLVDSAIQIQKDQLDSGNSIFEVHIVNKLYDFE